MDYIEIILEVLLILLGLYLAFYKSYFKEKGKNLATLEDIEEITSKVEAIKTDFLRETEKLKLDIQYTNQIKFTIKSEGLKCLFDFYEKYHLWLNILLDFYFGGYNEDNYEKLDIVEKNINDSYNQFLISDSKVKLFVNNPELYKTSGEMKIKTLEFQSFISLTMSKYKILMIETKLEKSIALKDGVEFNTKESHGKILDFVKKYNENKNEQYKNILVLNKKFQAITYQILTKVDEDRKEKIDE